MDMDLARDTVAPELARTLQTLGCQSLRATPLGLATGRSAAVRFGPDRLPRIADSHQLEIVGRLVGIASGTSILRQRKAPETEAEDQLEVPARLEPSSSTR